MRARQSLDGTWEFVPDPRRQFGPSLAGATLRPITVPGPWQAQFDDLRDYDGVAWYRLRFAPHAGLAPAADASRHLLRFGAVDYHATAWLNGIPIGEHEGGYLPFSFDVTRALRHDRPNELVVRVIDPGMDAESTPEFPFAEIPHGKQSWYGPVGGIWQSVVLERRSAVHVDRLRLTPDVPGERVRAEIVLSAPASALRLVLAVRDPRGRVRRHEFAVPEGASRIDEWIPVPEPLPWDTHAPHLYEITASLLDARDATVDEVSDRFGMRTIATSPDGHLLLNGRVVFLRGALDQDYYPELIYTPFSDAELDAQFAQARHLGLNLLRTHIKITDPRYYDAADRAGMLIWTELPNWQDLTPDAKRRARETLHGMVERDWNHPSIVIWTIANENWGLDLAVNADHRAWLSGMYDDLKALDPHRLVVGNSPCFTNFHVVTDIEDFHNYYAMPDHQRAWDEWVRTFAGRPPWTFAHAYRDYEEWRAYQKDPWTPAARQPAPEIRRTGQEPMVVSEFGNWGLPDVDRLKECYGGREPWWFETGLEWGEGVAYPHGAERRFRAWHIDKVFPSWADLAAASQRMQYTALKYQIEQIRRHPQIVGYVITELTDVHWEANGLLDLCRNPKAFHDVMGQVNGADAIVPLAQERIAFWEGERCEVPLGLSHFSPHDIAPCRVTWRLDLWPEVAGSFEGIAAERARLTRVGTVAFEVPQVPEAQRVRLALRVLAPDGSEVTRNHHELYFFPRAAGARCTGLRVASARTDLAFAQVEPVTDWRAADLLVVETLTDDVRRHLQAGGRVLWLAETPDAQRTHLGTLAVARRDGRTWQGDWASSMSWLRQDRLFRDIPSGGLVDFAFADLTPEAVLCGLTPREFAADVHAGLFVGWVHDVVGLVAERRIGDGRLLACTFRLGSRLGTNPVATIMARDMIAHAARG